LELAGPASTDAGRFGWADRRGVLLAPLGASVGYFLAAQLGLAFSFPTTGIAVLWPPVPVLVTALLLTPRWLWWAILGATLPAHLLAHMPLSAPVQVATLYYAANASQALLIAILWQRFCGRAPRFDSVHNTASFIAVAAIIAPAVVSVMLADILVLIGWVADPWLVWWPRFLTNALSALALLPPVLLVVTLKRPRLLGVSARRCLEAGLLALSLAAFGIAAVGDLLLQWRALPFLLCAPLALFLWAGVRFGVVGVSVALLVVAATSLCDASHGAGSIGLLSPRDAVLSLQLFLIELGVPVMLMAALVNERHGIATVLQESNERARGLAGKLLRAQERERTLIARELHDEIGQALTIVKINLETMRFTQDATTRSPLLDEGVALVEQAIEQVRDLSLLLRPAILEHLGLEAALRWLLKTQAQRVGYHAAFTAGEMPAGLSPDVEITCYRVVQEALTNIARHSRARNVFVHLQLVDGQVRLTIRDDGGGFDLAGVRQRAREGGSMGLLSLEERARLVDGRLCIVSSPGQGTTLILSLPYAGAALARHDGEPSPAQPGD
jgi:signal transduction histidine kinase